MTDSDKIAFLSDQIKELNRITKQLENIFPEKSFKLDGILIGNIVEVLVSHVYGIHLYKQSEKTHDGEVDGRKVQIKGTQKLSSIAIREEPEWLLVAHLDKEKGTIQEIYNGPGSDVWKYAKYVPSINSYTLRVSKLLELNRTIPEEKKIRPLIPVEILSLSVDDRKTKSY